MTASPKVNPTPVPGKPEPGEEFFRQSIADLSRRLGERASRQSTSEPQAAAEARRRAMKAYERERARKIRLVLTGAGAVIATAGLAWVVVLLGEPETLPSAPSQLASVQAGPPEPSTVPVATTASAVPLAEPQPAAPPQAAAQPQPVAQPQPAAPPQPVEPSPATQAATESQPPSTPVQADPPPPAPPPQVAAAPASEPPPRAQPEPQAEPANVTPAPAASTPPPVLGRDGIREVQKRLRGFGFNPGPVDGVAGRQTEIATQRYLETRGQPQLPPNDPQLLAQLREDQTPPPSPAPAQVAQRPNPPDHAYSGYSTQPSATAQQPQQRRYQSFDPFQPVKAAGAQITQWLEGVFRAPASN